MDKVSLYLDTSVPSAYLDARQPERQATTQRFWRMVLPTYAVYVSTPTLAEINETPDHQQRHQLRDLIRPYSILPIRKETEILAESFMEGGLLSPDQPRDALHIAIAVVEGIDILVSWNFEDMVNIRTRRLLPMLCAKHGYLKQPIIASPLEF